jgi:hypothetical protein
MMGWQTGDQRQLFYLFNLERRIPASHLLRRINGLGCLRCQKQCSDTSGDAADDHCCVSIGY